MTRPVTRGASPSKALMPVEEVVEQAINKPSQKILYSTGHSRYGGRVKANDIRVGRRAAWKPYVGLVSTSAIQQADGTYNVYISVHPDDLERWRAAREPDPGEE